MLMPMLMLIFVADADADADVDANAAIATIWDFGKKLDLEALGAAFDCL